MPDGSITFSVNLDAKEAHGEMSRLKKKIMELEAELQTSPGKKNDLEERLRKAAQAADEAKARVDALREAGANAGEIKEAEARAKALDAEFNKAADALDKYNAQIANTEHDLEKQKVMYGEIAKSAEEVNQHLQETPSAVKSGTSAVERFEKRIISLAKRVFVFSMITSALRSLRSWFVDVIKTDKNAVAAIAQLKGALLTLVQPLVSVVIPAFTTFIQVLTRVVGALASVVSAIFGTTVEKSAAAAENLENEKKALGGVGAAAKKAGKSLASFDEINQLSGGGEATGGGAGAADAEIAPDFSGVIDGQLGLIEGLIGGALLALGAILTFSGANIPLGLGLMAAGAVTLTAAISENWEIISQKLQGPIGKITAIISGALLALGALLAFSGANIKLGLGLMVAGATGLATTVTANWDKITELLGGPVGAITDLVGGALLMLGAILTFSGVNVPIGIALMAAGAAGLAASVMVNWDTIQNVLNGPVGSVVRLVSNAVLMLGAVLAFSGANIPLGIGLMAAGAVGLAATANVEWQTMQDTLSGSVGTVVALISGALLALGALLTFSGANIPLGLGLLVAGAIGLATSITANWDIIEKKLQGPLGGILAIISGALLVLGAILLFTGAGIPLGLGLLALGGLGLAASIAPNWDAILDKIKEVWQKISDWFNTHVKPVFTAKFWQEKFEAIKDGLKSAMNGALDIVEKAINWMVDKLNSLSFDIPDWVPGIGGGKFGFHIPQIQIPRLAAGAVIPPNREFLAVLGDQQSGNNIEAPEALLRQMAADAASANTALLQRIISLMESGRVLVVNDTTFAELVYNSNNNARNRHGSSLVTVRSMG